jgi:hypothetical protein
MIFTNIFSKIFSNGQYDVIKQWYYFVPKTKSFKKIEGDIPEGSLTLFYEGLPQCDVNVTEGCRHFNVKLFDYEQYLQRNLKTVESLKPLEEKSGIIRRRDKRGIIHRIDFNTDYYDIIDYIRLKASILETKSNK